MSLLKRRMFESLYLLCYVNRFAKASEYKDQLLNAMDSKNRELMVEISRVVYKNLQDILKK